MIDSTPAASGAVVDQRAAGTPQPVVEADAGGEAEEPREDALTQPSQGTRPMTLEREQVLAGPEDRFDALTNRRQVRTAAGFVGASGAHHRGAQISDCGRELTPGVTLVADEHFAAAASTTLEQFEADLALVARGRRQSERSGRTVRRAERVQAQTPEPARVSGAVAVAGHVREGRTLDRLPAAAALDGGRVDEQQFVARARALLREVGHEPLDRIDEATTALVVAGLAGQLREEMDEPLAGDRQEAPVGRDAHDRLGHAERDQLGIGDLPAGVRSRLWQKIVGCAINHGAESVEVGVHRGLQADGDLGTVGFGLSALLSLDRRNLVESIIYRPGQWLASFYHVCSSLAAVLGESLESLFGEAEAEHALRVLAEDRANVKK